MQRNDWSIILFVALLFPLIACSEPEEEDSLPSVNAVNDVATTQQDMAVTIRVLDNDAQDDDLITSHTQAVDGMGNTQAGSVEVTLDYPERLMYTPPAGFVGTVTFTYEIEGLGTVYSYESSDTAAVTVTVEGTGGGGGGMATVQFDDNSGIVASEGTQFFVNEQSIEFVQPGGTSACFMVPAGTNIPIRARLFSFPDSIEVNGNCPQLQDGGQYTITVQPGDPDLDIVCTEGLVAPALCP